MNPVGGELENEGINLQKANGPKNKWKIILGCVETDENKQKGSHTRKS